MQARLYHNNAAHRTAVRCNRMRRAAYTIAIEQAAGSMRRAACTHADVLRERERLVLDATVQLLLAGMTYAIGSRRSSRSSTRRPHACARRCTATDDLGTQCHLRAHSSASHDRQTKQQQQHEAVGATGTNTAVTWSEPKRSRQRIERTPVPRSEAI
jgi:hypothetical protein